MIDGVVQEVVLRRRYAFNMEPEAVRVPPPRLGAAVLAAKATRLWENILDQAKALEDWKELLEKRKQDYRRFGQQKMDSFWERAKVEPKLSLPATII